MTDRTALHPDAVALLGAVRDALTPPEGATDQDVRDMTAYTSGFLSSVVEDGTLNPSKGADRLRGTARDHAHAVHVRALLAAEDAPAVQWRTTPTRLEAVLSQVDFTPQEQLRGLAAWQRVLGAGPVQVRPTGVFEFHEISGSFQGVEVTVSTILRRPESADEQDVPAGGEAA